MCELATQGSNWIMVDHWESSQPKYVRTATVLDHFQQHLSTDQEVNGTTLDTSNGDVRQPLRIMLLAGGDLIQSFAVPNLWKEADVRFLL